MSEPDAALFRLRIARADVVRWLDAPVRRASAWTDHRTGGRIALRAPGRTRRGHILTAIGGGRDHPAFQGVRR